MLKPFPGIAPRFTPGLDARHRTQVARYNQGVQSGTLDTNEQAYMQNRNQQYKGMLADSKFDDGIIDVQERVAMHKFGNQTSREIFEFKHN